MSRRRFSSQRTDNQKRRQRRDRAAVFLILLRLITRVDALKGRAAECAVLHCGQALDPLWTRNEAFRPSDRHKVGGADPEHGMAVY